MSRFLNKIAAPIALLALCCQCAQPRYDNPDDGSGSKDPEPQEITTPVDSIFQFTLKGEDCNFADWADYGVYVPAGAKRIQGVLILQHGCGMEQFGLTRHYDLQYQAFARKWNLAVIETAIHGTCGLWGYPDKGSAEGLFKVLAKVAAKTHRDEITIAPWLLWGHSAGGFWTLGMLRDYPEKIIAAVCYSAAWDPGYEYNSVAAEVPLLMRHAGKDDGDASTKCPETAIHTFSSLRAKGAPVAIVYNRGQNHNLSYLRTMAIPFWEAALSQRLGAAGLKPLDPARTWLGDTTSFEIFKESGYAGDKSAMVRLPDEASAKAWKEFATTNVVVDKTAPSAPYDVTVRQNGDVLEISWKADADVESGIACFNIYRDGVPVGRVPEAGEYQSYNFNGDNTYPVPAPAMKYRLLETPAKAIRIGVEATNRDGLKSSITEIKYKP